MAVGSRFRDRQAVNQRLIISVCTDRYIAELATMLVGRYDAALAVCIFERTVWFRLLVCLKAERYAHCHCQVLLDEINNVRSEGVVHDNWGRDSAKD